VSPIGRRPEGGDLRGGCKDPSRHAGAHLPYPYVRGALYCAVCSPTATALERLARGTLFQPS
jgi:hypothetical protein